MHVTTFRFRAAVVFSTLAVLAGAFGVLVTVTAASAVSACPTWATETATECTVTGVHKITTAGPWTFAKTLHVTATGRVDGTDAPGGLNLQVNGAAGLNLVMDAGAWIETDDDHLAGDGTPAPPITIAVSGSVTMAKGSRISADNLFKLGNGGNITINVAGDMTLQGTAGTGTCAAVGSFSPQVYGNKTLGAVISAARRGGSGNSQSGTITINVGDASTTPPSGILTVQRCALIDGSSNGFGGVINVRAGKTAQVDGLVLSVSALTASGSGQHGGGPISMFSGCGLTVGDTGAIASIGRDNGSDLVHLESCDTLINGAVASGSYPTGGHAGAANLCNADTVAHPKAAGQYDGCVEIWSKTITIDQTGTHKGNVNVDGEVSNRGWIDLFATNDIAIKGPATTTTLWAVSGNAATNTNNLGGLITVKSVGGKVSTGGNAIRAQAIGGGGKGGDISVQSGGAAAAGNVDLSNSVMTTVSGGPGGTIKARSFNGSVTGAAPGKLLSTGKTPGSNNLTACVATSYTGTMTPADSTPGDNSGQCGTAPALTANAASALAADAAIWAACNGTTTTTTTTVTVPPTTTTTAPPPTTTTTVTEPPTTTTTAPPPTTTTTAPPPTTTTAPSTTSTTFEP